MNWADTFGGNSAIGDLASSYTEPAGLNIDFLKPTDSGISWSDIYANPDALKGLGESYKDPFNKDNLDFLSQFIDKEKENQFLDSEKAASGLPSSQGRGNSSWAVPVSPSVTITGEGNSPIYGSAAKYSNLASAGAGLGALQGGMRMAGGGMGVKDIVGMGMNALGGGLKSKALYAINPVLGAVDQFYPGGAPAAFKDVTGVLGKAGNSVARFAGDAVGGVGDFFKGIFCDERLKVDIAPLESTEVNDELAQMAFFVKGLRECS